jgi:hypothetical protein
MLLPKLQRMSLEHLFGEDHCSTIVLNLEPIEAVDMPGLRVQVV